MNYKFVLKVFRSKSGSDCRILSLDLGYTVKFLCYNANDVAEILGVSVRQLVESYPIKEDSYNVVVGDVALC